jgi:thymidylate synthase
MNKKLTKEEFLEKLKTDKDFNKKYGRKDITEGKQVLPPCHYGFQVYTRELEPRERLRISTNYGNIHDIGANWDVSHKLIDDMCDKWGVPKRAISLMWNQRSVDTFLGLPFNIASYGLLLEIIAKEVNMVPDELIGNLGDTHLYLNHIEQAKEQIGRELTLMERTDWWFENIKPNRSVMEDLESSPSNVQEKYFDEIGVPKRTREPYPLPKLFFKYEKETYVNDYELDGFILKDYQSHPAIKAPLSN